MHLDLVKLIETVGYLGLFVIVFAESGLLFGFFLPGDSLLFTAGFLASTGILSYPFLLVLLSLAAIGGDSVGYAFGKKVGPRIFKKEDSLLFHRDHIRRAQTFYQKHGKKTIVLARFMPIIRTFAPIVAGIGGMHYPTFLFYNIFGGLFWVVGMTSLGYFLGNVLPDPDKYILPIAFLIIIISLLPSVIHIVKNQAHRQEILLIFSKINKSLKSKTSQF